MSSSSSTSALIPPLDLKPSRRLLALLVSAYVLATVGLLSADIALWIKLLLGLMLAVFARWHWNRYAAPLSPFFVRRLTFHSDAHGLLEYGNGREWSGQLCGALVTNMLVIVHSRNGWKRRSTVIVPDALSEDHFRRLRVYLNTRVWEESEEDI